MREDHEIEAVVTGPAETTRVRPMPPGFVLLFAVVAMSWAGPLVRFSSADALVIAAWRLIFSVVLIGIVLVARRQLGAILRLTARQWTLAFGSGAMLAAHFWAWNTSLQWTTVASSVVLVTTQPIFVAIFSALFLGEAASRRQWAGIVVAVMGAAVIGWGDFLPAASGGARSALIGDLLAIAGAIFAAGYFVIGRTLRQHLDLWVYVGVVYGIAAGLVVLAVLVGGSGRLGGYPPGDWLVFLALAVGPMMIGHTGVNYALRYMRAHVANLVVLGEPVGATLIAWALPAIGETPTPQVFFGGLLIGAGILLGSRRASRTEDRTGVAVME